MGRGLSALQQQILVLAWEKEQRGIDTPLYPHEILLQRYDWPLTEGGHVRVDTGRSAHERGLYFARSQIGAQAYNAAHVALLRSTDRLQARGLIRHTWQESGGLRLTDAGRETVKQLTVKYCV
jgi:hypothetical protein